MLFVDEFCGILVYIKFGADVTSQYINKMGELSGVSYTIQWEYKDSSTESKPQSDGATEQSE